MRLFQFQKSFSISWVPGGRHPFGWEERSVLAPLLDEAAPRAVGRDAIAVAHRIRHGEREGRWRNLLHCVLLLPFLVLFLCLLPWKYPIELLMKRGWSEGAAGTVVSLEQSAFSSNVGNNPTVHYYYVGIQFLTRDGETVTANRTAADTAPIPEVGDVLSVSYFPLLPSVVTYAGAESGSDFIRLIFSLVFLAVALALSIPFLIWRRVRRRIGKVLAFGENAVADITGMEETKLEINGHPVVRFRLAVKRNGMTEETCVKTRGHTGDVLAELKRKGGRLCIFYLPGEQEEAVPVEAVEPAGARE